MTEEKYIKYDACCGLCGEMFKPHQPVEIIIKRTGWIFKKLKRVSLQHYSVCPKDLEAQ